MTTNVEPIFQNQLKRSLELRESSAKDRIAKLKKLLAVIEKEKQAIYDAGKNDFGKPEAEIDLTEIFAVVAETKHTIRHLKKWMKPKKVLPTLASSGTSSKVLNEPKGRCLIISPWNYPFNLSLCPLVSAISAGNTVILKPSELTPHFSKVLSNIVSQVFEPEEVGVVEGDAEVASALLKLPFDHIFYTGSPAIGKIVMEAAAKNLTSCTLELGGKSPTIIDQSANLKTAARNVMWGKFTNKGQTCIAPDYVYVHESVKDEFIKACKEQVEKTFGASVEAQQSSPDYCRIVNERHFDRVKNLLDDAKDKGAKIEFGDKLERSDRFIAPTMLSNVADNSLILEEEIFGPLMPVITYSHIDEVVSYINARPKPLALYIYAKDKKIINQVLSQTSSGGVCINHNMLHFLQFNLPFGGVNNSGIGNTHGKYGFEDFSHQRSVLQDKFSVVHWMYPPYTPLVKTLIKNTIKFLS
jgi:aldehyde dehydrogenase (NAD+)